MKTIIEKKILGEDIQEVKSTLLCARWLVHHFENLNFGSIARLFQRAINDSESWIENMVQQGGLSEEVVEPIKAEEAKVIHNILIKYASIEDTKIREGILDEMQKLTKKTYN